jgi:hypothetical protein
MDNIKQIQHSLLVTNNEFFSDYVSHYMKGLLKQSNMISLYGAKDRNRFFNTLYQSIAQLKEKLGNLYLLNYCKKINSWPAKRAMICKKSKPGC